MVNYVCMFETTHIRTHTHIHTPFRSCPECCNEREKAEHILFTCPRYVDQRNCLERRMGFQVTPDNIVNLMLIACDNWNAVSVFAMRLLTQQRLHSLNHHPRSNIWSWSRRVLLCSDYQFCLAWIGQYRRIQYLVLTVRRYVSYSSYLTYLLNWSLHYIQSGLQFMLVINLSRKC